MNDEAELIFYAYTGWTASEISEEIQRNCRITMRDKPSTVFTKHFKIRIEEIP